MKTTVLNNGTLAEPQRSLEELVDRLMTALFREKPETAATEIKSPQSVARTVHDARRMRQAGDLDGALGVLAGVEMKNAATKEVRWAYAEWLSLVGRRFADYGALLYSQGVGRAAALVPKGEGALEVAAVLGMRWRPGKLVSRNSLRGLRPLGKGGASW